MIKKFLAPAVAALLSVLVVYGLMPPPRRAAAQFADQGTWGTATLNTGVQPNVLTLTIANIGTFHDIIGVPLRFNPPANNNGPVNVVITNGLGTLAATALDRPSSIGLTALSSSELWNGETTSITYNGTQFVLTSNVDMRAIGEPVEFRGTTAPRGTLIEDGSCYSETGNYAPLFSVIGTSYNAQAPGGSCPGGQFAVPDSRGDSFVAFDNQGANGAASRVTSAGSGCNATAIGQCGAQSQTLTSTQLPNVTVNVTSSGAFGHANSLVGGLNSGGGNAIGFDNSGAQSTVSSSGSFGGGAAHPILNPISIGLRAIKY